MKKTTIAIVLMALFTACSDFLEPKSESEIIPDTTESLNELLLGEAYPKYSDRIYMDVFLGLLDDDIAYYQYVEEDNITYTGMMEPIEAAFTWQADMFSIFRISDFQSTIYNTWQNVYRGILGANAVLDYLDKVSGTESEKKQVRAQALALRGFYHFQLANIYGEPYFYNKNALAVPLKHDSNVSVDGKVQNTVEEVYISVIEDLTEAEQLLQTLDEEDQWKKDYRVSVPMVQLLLSRVYLYMEDWENTAIYGEKVLQNSNFQLLDLNTLPQPSSETAYYNFMDYYNNPEVIWLYGQVTDAFYLQMFMSTTNASTDDNEPKALFKVSDELLAIYEASDLRPIQYIFDDYSGKYKVPMGKIEVDVNRSTSSEGFGRAFRYSEAYLNTAEACAILNLQNGDAEAGTKALQLINELRAYRISTEAYSPLAALSPEELLIEVRNERRRELCFEGQRWFDLRRQGMPSITHVWYSSETEQSTYTLEDNDPLYTMGIPEEALIQNPQLIN